MSQTQIFRSPKTVLIEGDCSRWQVAITRETIQRILQSNCRNTGDMLALWMFYAYTAKWQHVNRPKATTAYSAKGLKWTVERVRKAKNALAALGLVGDAIVKNDKGKVVGWFVQVFHLASVDENHPTDFPEGGKRGDKCSRSSNLNALGTKSPIASVGDGLSGQKKPTREEYESFCEEQCPWLLNFRDYDSIVWVNILWNWQNFILALANKVEYSKKKSK